MAIRDVFKLSRKTFFNPTGWIDLSYLKELNLTLWEIIKSLFSVPSQMREESFAVAKERLNLTEKDIASRIVRYRLYAIFFFILGMLIFFYSFFLLFRHVSVTGLILGFASSALFLSQAFRFDFWSLQLRRRTLGLSFKEWKKSYLGSDKGASS